MRILIPLLTTFFTGCATVIYWDGAFGEATYEIVFQESSGKPIAGVETECEGDDIWPSTEIAKEVNRLVKPSDKNGLVVLSHSTYGVGGT